MGTAASQEDESKVGYRVLGVLPDSPASKASLVSFFDFLGKLVFTKAFVALILNLLYLNCYCL